MSARTFDRDDKLHRQGYAKFIKALLSDTSKYKRDSDTKSFVLAIDAPWGTGKSYFIEMLSNYLEAQNPPNTEFRVLLYNVWKNDFWDNAFEPLIYAILTDDRFKIPDETRRKDLIAKCASCIPSIIKGIALQPIRVLAGNKAADDISIAADSAFDWFADIKSICDEYEAFLRGIENLKAVLAEYIELIGNKRKLVIIIDELDRCKPTFAIQTLEIVKHLFDVDGITFVFSLDIQQLSHSIKCVYGEGMDSVGYIMRFFDYICKMPSPDKKNYIEYLITERPLNLTKSNSIELVDFFISISNILSLSLRDIQTIFTSFLILEKFEFPEISNVDLYKNYLSVLSVKYKDPKFFDFLFSERGRKMPEYMNIDYSVFPADLKDLIDSNDYLLAMRIKIDRFPDNYIIDFVDNNNVHFLDPTQEIKIGNIRSLSPGFLANGILTSKDLRNWNEIKHLKVCEFIHRKLEIFDFSYMREEASTEK